MTTWLQQGHALYPARHWYAAYLKPKMDEATVAARIEEVGFETYVPIVSDPIYRTDGRLKGRRQSPLLPRYVLTSFDPYIDLWGKIRDLEAVTTILHGDGMPRQIPDGIIDELRSREVRGVIRAERVAPVNRFKVENQVEVIAGPFREHIGKVILAKKADRSMVFFAEMLGGQEVEIPNEHLKLAG